jgi:hypothetical protein
VKGERGKAVLASKFEGEEAALDLY